MKNINNYEKLNYKPKKLYHFTLFNNISSILKSKKLNQDCFGYVYLTETLEDVEEFAIKRVNVANIDIKNIVILEIDTHEGIDVNNLYISNDHVSEEHSGAKAIAYNGDLEIRNYNLRKFI